MNLLAARELYAITDRFLREAQEALGSAALSPHVQNVEDAFTDMFNQQQAVIQAALVVPAGQPEPSIDDVNWDAILAGALVAGAQGAVNALASGVAAGMSAGAAANGGALALGLSFDVDNPQAVAYLQQHGAALVSQINETTRTQMQALLARARTEGWSYDRVAAEIIARWEQFAVGRPQEHIDSRAHLIAVTEIGNAYEEGTYQSAKRIQDIGIVMEKAWLTVGDARVCSEECAINEAADWIPLLAVFPSGHERPLAHPSCRCTLLTRRKRR